MKTVGWFGTRSGVEVVLNSEERERENMKSKEFCQEKEMVEW